MKKFLLSLAAVACAASMSATTITLFDIASPGAWTGDGNGYTQTRTVDGVEVTITTDKAASTTALLSPDNNTYAWRVYKNSNFTIETKNFNMKSVLITYDNLSNNQYALAMALSSGWTGKLSGAEFILSSAGLSSFTATADAGQVRIKTIVASDSEELTGSGSGDSGSGDSGEITPAPDPETITGTITVAKALEMIGAGSEETVKVKGYITKIDEISTSYGNATYYIADEKGGATTLEVFRGKWVDGENFKSESQIAVGGLIVVEGKLTNYNGTYELGTGNKVLGYKAPEGGSEQPGDQNGDISSAITVAEALAKINAGETGKAMVKGYITTIDEVNTSYGNATFDIADEKGGSPVLKIYRAKWINNANFTSTNQIAVGGFIAVEGELVLYGGKTPEMTQGGQVISYTAPEGGPELPEGVLYQQEFTSSLGDWQKVNDTSIGDFAGWKINNSDNAPACAICNPYYSGANHACNARLQREFNLADCKKVSFSFEQAYGYEFPTSQTPNARAYVIYDGYTDYLTMSNFPPAPASGNWTKEWATNEFDLSEYDGETIIIGFEYANDGNTEIVWEIKNFVLYGEGRLGGVDGVELDNDATPVYYNLQGVRVANPEKGVYIMVKGNQVTKILK